AWLLKEAKVRNPHIRTYGLAWGVPGWIGNGTFFSKDNIVYHVSWLKCIKETLDIEIDYVGIWNERDWGAAWYVSDLAAAIKEANLTTKLVMLDAVASQVKQDFLSKFEEDERFQELISAVGLHYPCNDNEQLSEALRRHPSTRFWASEETSTVADWGGAGCWGRMINQNYVRMNATSSIAWSLIWSVYPNLECFGNGLLYAFEPWSGHYEVMAPVWMSAHTTQFTKIGWVYLPAGQGAGNLPEGGTYVTIASADLVDFTVVLETLQGSCMYNDGCLHSIKAQTTQSLQLQLSSKLAAAARGRSLEVWATNSSHWFQRLPDVQVTEQGFLRIDVPVDAIITISTLGTATKQGNRTAAATLLEAQVPPQQPFPFPFLEDFESQPLYRAAAFFADQGGAFEVVEAATFWVEGSAGLTAALFLFVSIDVLLLLLSLSLCLSLVPTLCLKTWISIPEACARSTGATLMLGCQGSFISGLEAKVSKGSHHISVQEHLSIQLELASSMRRCKVQALVLHPSVWTFCRWQHIVKAASAASGQNFDCVKQHERLVGVHTESVSSLERVATGASRCC
ncbi:galc, partial [Symbiodinium necroappetens]